MFSYLQSTGVGTKATQSSARTNQLYEAASKNRDELNNEILPQIEAAMMDVDGVGAKNKVTKKMVEETSK